MAAKQFTPEEWKKIRATLDKNPQAYGLPKRIYGSAVIGSFNVRKLGRSRGRSPETWDFLAHIIKQYDLMAVQEVMDDLSGLKRIMDLLGPEYGMVVSDRTGAFPGAAGLAERLAFVFRWTVVRRGEVVSDISYDRSKVLEILAKNLDGSDMQKGIYSAMKPLADYYKKMEEYKVGSRSKKPSKPRKVKMPVFLSFIRQPFCVSFQIVGFPDTKPYRFMAVNAHLMFGQMSDRRMEFDALMDWITERVKQNDKAYYPNFILLGDLNLDFNNPVTDRKRIEEHLKTFNNNSGEEVHVNFPFLDPHPGKTQPFKTNARENQTFDQIGLFFREQGLPTHIDNKTMGKNPEGPDYGVFNFVKLFRDALGKENAPYPRFEHKVSDHMPLWLRLPLPKN